MSIQINNPTQLSFKHDMFRAENVTIIPTPNNSSDLATMITDTTYYEISNDSECRYKKVITPKTNVERTNYYKNDGKPVGAKVCHYGPNQEKKHYEVDNGVKTVKFDVDGVMIRGQNISDSEIFFKGSDDAPLDLTVFDNTNSVTLEDNSTRTNFSFNVPNCVHKVEIKHNMDAALQGDDNKAKIHIDLDDGKNIYYISEKRNTIGDQTSVAVFTNIYGKELQNVMSTAKDSQLLKVDLGNGYIYFCNFSGGDIYRAYWDNTVGETEHIYSFTTDDGEGYTIKSFKESLEGNYEFLMKLSELGDKISNTSYKDEPDLEKTQKTGLYFPGGGQEIRVNEEYYTGDKSNYPGLYTACNALLDQNKSSNVGYFFLKGTNHIFKITSLDSGDDKAATKPHTLNLTDIENGLEVFTGGTFTKEDLTIDDTYTSQLNFGTLCNELAKDLTSSNILNSSSTASSE